MGAESVDSSGECNHDWDCAKPSHDLMMKLGILPMDNGLWTDTGAPVSESVHNTQRVIASNRPMQCDAAGIASMHAVRYVCMHRACQRFHTCCCPCHPVVRSSELAMHCGSSSCSPHTSTTRPGFASVICSFVHTFLYLQHIYMPVLVRREDSCMCLRM